MKDAYEIIFMQEHTASPVTMQVVKFRTFTFNEAMEMLTSLLSFGDDMPGVGRIEARIRPLTEDDK